MCTPQLSKLSGKVSSQQCESVNICHQRINWLRNDMVSFPKYDLSDDEESGEPRNILDVNREFTALGLPGPAFKLQPPASSHHDVGVD
jgi:hypothetical protein